MTTDRDRIDRLMREAQEAMHRREYDTAADLYDEAAAVNPQLYTEIVVDLVRGDLAAQGEETQRAATREVIRLLGQSFDAWAAGDKEGAQRIADAAASHNPDAYVVIMGGIRIGEIPNPERDPAGWAAFVAAAS